MSKVGVCLYRLSVLALGLAALAWLACIEQELAALFLIARDLRPVAKVPANPSPTLHTDPLPDCPA